jgi:ParB family chromosome partitioning protein
MSAIEEPKEKRRALGRGLDSLLPSGPRLATAIVPSPAVMPAPVLAGAIAAAQAVADARPGANGNAIQQITLDLIDHNPYQTRRSFDEAALQELAESIQESGLAQPIVVRPGANGRYILVLGERRCRASKLAGKTTVPAIVRQLGNEQAAELTVIENLQRQDLNCLEQANAFARLSREFSLTQEQIAKRVSRLPTTCAC